MEQYLNEQVLVAGSGSIGRRHMRNLAKLGFKKIAACDIDPARLTPMIEELNVQPFTDYEMAVQETQPRFVLVSTPPVFHVPQTRRAIQAGAHVFVEKPVSNSNDDIDDLIREANEHQKIVLVGYNFRFHPILHKIKQMLNDGAIGKPLWVYAEIAQYLPDWRPWQDYRQSYTARKELGGGIILDASHEIDYVTWLLGYPLDIMCMADTVSNLEVDVEDCATILMRFPNKVHATIHLDFVQRVPSRLLRVVGETGTIEWALRTNTLSLNTPERQESTVYSYDLNQMYIDELQHFFECAAHGTEPRVNLLSGKRVVTIALAALDSAQTGKKIRIDE